MAIPRTWQAAKATLRALWPHALTILATDGGTNDGNGVEVTGTSAGAVNVNIVGGLGTVRRANFATGSSHLANAQAGDPLAVDLATTQAITITAPAAHVLQSVSVIVHAALTGSTSGQIDITAFGGDTYEQQIDILGGSDVSTVVEGVTLVSVDVLTFFASKFPACTSIVVTVSPSSLPALTGGWIEVKCTLLPQR